MGIGRGEEMPAVEYSDLADERPVDHFTLPSRKPVGGGRGRCGSWHIVCGPGGWTRARLGRRGSGNLGTTPLAEFETRAQPRMKTNTPTPVAVSVDAVDIS